MKKTLIALSLFTAFNVSAFTSTTATNNDVTSAIKPSVFPAIDSSNWKVNPEDYGMTVEEYFLAESHAFMNEFAINRELGVNNFFHFTKLAKAEDKWVVSPSLDHLYSIAIVDASKGFSITVPENIDKRFVSLHIQDENHTFVDYEVGAGTFTYDAKDVDTKYVVVGIRMASDGTEQNLDYIANTLQSQYQINAGSADSNIPSVDLAKMMKVRTALITEYDKLPNTYETVTYDINDVSNWEKTTYSIAGAWGLSPEDTAMYPAYALKGVEGGSCYQANYPAPPTRLEDGGYFSITVYGEDKYLMSDEYNIVSSNHASTKYNSDGSFDVIFGSMECKTVADITGSNFAYTPDDNWGFLMRVYLPKVDEMKQYKMPEITPIK